MFLSFTRRKTLKKKKEDIKWIWTWEKLCEKKECVLCFWKCREYSELLVFYKFVEEVWDFWINILLVIQKKMPKFLEPCTYVINSHSTYAFFHGQIAPKIKSEGIWNNKTVFYNVRIMFGLLSEFKLGWIIIFGRYDITSSYKILRH